MIAERSGVSAVYLVHGHGPGVPLAIYLEISVSIDTDDGGLWNRSCRVARDCSPGASLGDLLWRRAGTLIRLEPDRRRP